MIYKYEKACKEAGMSEEAVAELRRMFDADKKKLKRLNKRLNDKNDQLYIYHVSDMVDQEGHAAEYEIEDPDADVECSVIKEVLLEQLNFYLDQLKADERTFILTYFSFKSKPVNQTAIIYGVTPASVIWKRNKILKDLQKKFSEKE